MYIIPEKYTNELKKYRDLTEMILQGKTDPVQFKIFRVVRGIYEQRKKDTFMVRVRCAGGIITPSQLSEVAIISEQYGSPYLHITTRQEIQLHNINLKDTPDILERLNEIGLSTKGSGGNTVRNITASPESGISIDEAFDVTPYNIALTNFLLGYEKSFDLPRKLKMAFSCSDKDTALAAFNDIGFIAKIENGVKGFKVYIGGSPSVRPMVGHVLFEFIPVEKIFGVVLAVMELFDKHGNRKNRHKARLRYVFYKLGKEKVFDLFYEIYNQYKNKPIDCRIKNMVTGKKQSINIVSENIDEDEFKKWKDLHVTEQKQPGLFTVEVPVMHGNMTNAGAKELVRFLQNFGEDILRFSRRQNIHIRNIPSAFLGSLFSVLNKAGLIDLKHRLLGNLVSCTGADTCQLGICFSKGGLQAIHDKLTKNPVMQEIHPVSINISGCPNSCGQHLVADLGFAGRVSRNNRIYPSYNVFAGSVIGEKEPALPIRLGEVAARDLPEFTEKILNLYFQKANGKPFRYFVDKEQQAIKELFEDYKEIPSFQENKKYYIDWGNNGLFTLDTRGGGECSAGLLDMIESEIRVIHKCKESLTGQQETAELTVLLHELVISVSKLLCLTIQEQPESENAVFDLITEKFLKKGVVSNKCKDIFEWVNKGNFARLIRSKEEVINYADEVLEFYNNLDDSLQPKNVVKEITVKELKKLLDSQADIDLIDVRESWEKEIANLGGELIPLGILENNLERFDVNKKTIVYCRTGRRSAEAIQLIAKNKDTKNIYNLRGGIYAWADEIDPTFQKY